jgi:hypothetical protein
MLSPRVDSKPGVAVLSRDKRSSRIELFTGTVGVPVSLRHGLGLIPQDVTLCRKAAFCDLKVISMDDFTALVDFSVSNVMVTIRFEA